MFELMGIEENFWKVCGDRNPFEYLLFHDMNVHQRVALVKSLADFLMVSDIFLCFFYTVQHFLLNKSLLVFLMVREIFA